MVAWSTLYSASRLYFTGSKSLLQYVSNDAKAVILKRTMSGHDNKFPMQPSRWQWHKFKDLFHYYFMVGLIPVTGIILYCNIFIGPAQLAEIPEGYTPKHWEYERHPITRFLARYFYNSKQQEYEKRLHYLYEEDEKGKIRRLTKQIQEKMMQRNDYQAYYYVPVTTKYLKISKESSENLTRVTGEN